MARRRFASYGADGSSVFYRPGRCLCGIGCEIRGELFYVSRKDVFGPVRYSFWFGAGVCPRCSRVVQYASGGDRYDHRHARVWVLGKDAESVSGRPRVWPQDWPRS